jgi:hypothetical protein
VRDPFDQVIDQQTIPWSGLCPDSDGDSFLDDIDCAPDNATAWSQPGEVQIRWTNVTALAWAAPSDKGGTFNPVYDLLESPAAANFSAPSASCLLTGSIALSYTENVSPSPGQARYYLVRSRNVCGGTLGSNSSGVERIGRSCP